MRPARIGRLAAAALLVTMTVSMPLAAALPSTTWVLDEVHKALLCERMLVAGNRCAWQIADPSLPLPWGYDPWIIREANKALECAEDLLGFDYCDWRPDGPPCWPVVALPPGACPPL